MANATDTPSVVSFRDYTEYVIAEKLWIGVSPFLIIVGYISSVLSVVVLFRKRMRNSTTMFYLMVLAVGDMMVLGTGLLRYWLKYSFEEDVRHMSHFSCKLHVFLVYFSLDFTTWILVAVTVDRCIFVCLPFQAKQLCTMKHAKATAVGIACVMFAINFHLFWGVALQLDNGELSCDSVNQFTAKTWPWIDFCIFSILPFSVMITCNVCIIRRIIHSRKRVNIHSSADRTPTVSDVVATGDHHNHHHQPQKKVNKKLPSVTSMLLSVNCVFLFLTLPIVIYLIVLSYVKHTVNQHEKAVMQIAWAIVNLLQYTNNAVHFFLYCLTGPRFRKELLSLFRKSKSGPVLEKSVTMELN